MYAAAAAAKSLQSCPTLQPHRRQPTRLCRPWDSPGKNTGVGCYFLLRLMYAGLHKILSTGNVVHSGSGQGNWPISPGLSNQQLTPHRFPSLRAHHPNWLEPVPCQRTRMALYRHPGCCHCGSWLGAWGTAQDITWRTDSE